MNSFPLLDSGSGSNNLNSLFEEPSIPNHLRHLEIIDLYLTEIPMERVYTIVRRHAGQNVDAEEVPGHDL